MQGQILVNRDISHENLVSCRRGIQRSNSRKRFLYVIFRVESVPYMYKLYRASFAELETFTIMFSIKKPRIQKKYHILIAFRYYTPALSAYVISSGH